ncbi:MAG TPA: ribonuclease domain-containing protein [Rhodanobacter sp.]
MRQLKSLLVLGLVIFAVMWWQQQTPAPINQNAAPTAVGVSTRGTTAADAFPAGDALPAEARNTLQHIARGGPFAHRQDGGVFGNYEGLLPSAARGYYHEYTVETPGAGNRAARRIITGGTPPVVYYYTDDHYRSFRRIRGKP